ncbi:MAG TPA: potassium-transporting ATPase subunit KdpA [Bacteroidales bacterium]|jgi:K+-transporting ATPase ATPase A chain|nr:potassium-transporting ATPase subunit KdpA [Bacteroidales bacterium]
MTFQDNLQAIILIAVLILTTPLAGSYMAKVFTGKKHFMVPVLGWLERTAYKVTGTNPEVEQNWKQYAVSLLFFNVTGIVFLFLMQIFQACLPLNPRHLPDVSWPTAVNTAISFVTNTNWQAYAGETTLSYFVQMTGLTVQNFVSAATGIAVLLALTRGIARRSIAGIGNFGVDITRAVIYVLLPLSVLFAIVLTGQGVIQNFGDYETVETLQGAQQVIPMGPVASQVAIKQLGSNGGGFFNANSSHPFENPTPLTNFLEMLAILVIPAALTYTYGKMAGSLKHGWTIFIAMMLLLTAGLGISLLSEYSSNPVVGHLPLMEGKETRIGVSGSVIWSAITSAAGNGSVNAMHDSLTPVAGLVAMINIMLGEIIFGAAGSGLYGMVIFIILTVFIAGLMVGRTPEYLGKKIESFEIRMAVLAVLIPNLAILLLSALAVICPKGLSGPGNPGPHGLSEILYAYSSATGNNGSAFAGLNAGDIFYNLTLGFAMLAGRFGIIIPVLAIAGNMTGKKITPASSGTFRTDTLLFICLLMAVILIIGGLTYFPALSLGPVIEHFLLSRGITF